MLDRETFEAFYLDLESPLYNTVYRWVWNEAEAMDLVQEAFMRLWTVRRKVPATAARAYVFRIALNLAANRRRSRKLWHWVGLEAFKNSGGDQLRPSQDDALEAQQQQELVRQALDGLAERYRQVVILCRFSGLSYRQVGELLKIPEGTVASRHHKALALLRESLRRLGVGSEI